MSKFSNISILFLLLSFAVSARLSAQTSWVGAVLPFLPEHDTTHLRCVRVYVPSTVVMGARTLKDSSCYDRHGYKVSSLVEQRYDTLGRLVGRLEKTHYWDDDRGSWLCDTISQHRVGYTTEGLVDFYLGVYYERHVAAVDTTIDFIRLMHFERNVRHGITHCEYSYEEEEHPSNYYDRPAESIRDTIVCDRQFDSLGRMLRESYIGGSRGLDDYEVRYTYDGHGRILCEKNSFYGGHDSLAYHYNILGNLMEKSGKAWVQGIESDIFISCRPDGTAIQRTEIEYETDWDYGANPENRQVRRVFYDLRGNPVRVENTEAGIPVYEFDNEYYF